LESYDVAGGFWSLGHYDAMKRKYILIALALVACLSVSAWLFCRQYPVPPWAVFRAQARINLVHPGMTETQFWNTLGLSRYEFFKDAMGSGPPRSFPMNYILGYHQILYCRWDTTQRPMVLVEARFKRHLDDN
jgi:hypothetical protein